MKQLLSFGLVLLLCGCVANASPPPSPSIEHGEPYTLDKNDTSAIEEGLRRSLKDPDSAKFGNMQAAKMSNGIIGVCGLVNAKNSFGGYTGMKPYIGFMQQKPKRLFATSAIGSDETSVMIVLRMCSQQGTPI